MKYANFCNPVIKPILTRITRLKSVYTEMYVITEYDWNL